MGRYSCLGIMKYYHYVVAVTRCYVLICTSVNNFDFKRAYINFAGSYGSVTDPSDVTVYVNTGIVGQHRCYRVTLIVINFISYKQYIFFTPVGIWARVNKIEVMSR